MAKTLTAVGVVRQALGHRADTVGKDKMGNVVVRKGYFYRMGQTHQTFTAKVEEALTAAGVKFRIVRDGDHYAPFRGGKGVASNSHFYVEIAVEQA